MLVTPAVAGWAQGGWASRTWGQEASYPAVGPALQGAPRVPLVAPRSEDVAPVHEVGYCDVSCIWVVALWAATLHGSSSRLWDRLGLSTR